MSPAAMTFQLANPIGQSTLSIPPQARSVTVTSAMVGLNSSLQPTALPVAPLITAGPYVSPDKVVLTGIPTMPAAIPLSTFPKQALSDAQSIDAANTQALAFLKAHRTQVEMIAGTKQAFPDVEVITGDAANDYCNQFKLAALYEHPDWRIYNQPNDDKKPKLYISDKASNIITAHEIIHLFHMNAGVANGTTRILDEAALKFRNEFNSTPANPIAHAFKVLYYRLLVAPILWMKHLAFRDPSTEVKAQTVGDALRLNTLQEQRVDAFFAQYGKELGLSFSDRMFHRLHAFFTSNLMYTLSYRLDNQTEATLANQNAAINETPSPAISPASSSLAVMA